MCPLASPDGLVKAFELEGGAIVDALGKSVEGLAAPDVLYHYTDARGLEGILKYGTLWFTNIFQLNDPSELSHGVDIALEMVGSAARVSGKAEHLLSAKIFREAVKKVIDSSAFYFVACLSYHADDLNQWRAYADNGQGYALAFDRAALEKAFMAAAPDNHSTFAVTYDDGHLRSWLKRLIDAWMPFVSAPHGMDLTGEQIADYQKGLAVQLALQIFQAAMLHKNEHYRPEQEYRFLQLFAADKTVPGLLTRDRKGETIRYRVFDWKSLAPSALKGIVIGPAAEKKAAGKFVTECLNQFMTTPGIVNIAASTIPYRA